MYHCFCCLSVTKFKLHFLLQPLRQFIEMVQRLRPIKIRSYKTLGGLAGQETSRFIKQFDRLPEDSLPSGFVPAFVKYLLYPVRDEMQTAWHHARQV